MQSSAFPRQKCVSKLYEQTSKFHYFRMLSRPVVSLSKRTFMAPYKVNIPNLSLLIVVFRVASILTHQSAFTGVPVKCPVKPFWPVVFWLLWLLSINSSTENTSLPTTKCHLAISKWVSLLSIM